jgi:multidrug resistance efflux pump
MSLTMFVGRVVLPGAGLFLATILAWQSVRAITDHTPAKTPGGSSAGAPELSSWIVAEGRVVAYPGAQLTAGTEVLGTIITMPFGEKGKVHKGDLLVELASDLVRASLREAHHHLSETEVGLRVEQARGGLDRIRPVVSGKPQPEDARRETLAAALARRDAARAAVDRLDAEVARYRLVAPIDGVVIARHAHPGETVSPAAPLVTIADLTRLRIEAEVDEFDIARVRLGETARITAEGYPGRHWRGEVEEIADAVVARQARPEDPGRPTDTRVLLVKVALHEPCPLKLHQRVEVQIDSRERELLDKTAQKRLK